MASHCIQSKTPNLSKSFMDSVIWPLLTPPVVSSGLSLSLLLQPPWLTLSPRPQFLFSLELCSPGFPKPSAKKEPATNVVVCFHPRPCFMLYINKENQNTSFVTACFLSSFISIYLSGYSQSPFLNGELWKAWSLGCPAFPCIHSHPQNLPLLAE